MGAGAMGDAVTPFRIEVSEAELEDLRDRLARTRWPERETVEDWSQGVPLEYLRRLCKHWAEAYDWRATERRLNAMPQFRTTIDGVSVHFVNVRSRHAAALPLVMTHGWPGSIVEFLDVIGPLTDPTAYGGSPADAFHLVCPSLPGYGFSDKPTRPGWGGRADRGGLGDLDGPSRLRALWRPRQRLGHEHQRERGPAGLRSRRRHPSHAAARAARPRDVQRSQPARAGGPRRARACR